MLKKFYATTFTSLYEIRVENSYPVLEKIILRGNSAVSAGTVLKNGTMLSIGKQLILFVPEGGGNSFERDISKVNTRYWGGRTSSVTGLFLEKKDAEKFFNCDCAGCADSDCVKSTKKVLDSIGKKHPQFSITTYPGLALDI